MAGQNYRSSEELALAQKLDPLQIMHAQMMSLKAITPNALEELDQQITQAVVDSVAFARQSPYPALESIYEDGWI